ncbi:DUF1906 domain-containing protein [Streptomyces pathocidini]
MMAALLAALAALFGGLFTGSTASAKGSPGDAQNSDPRSEGAAVFNGLAFDTCQTPSLGSMNAWRKSHYRAVGVYFGGRGRACKKQANLGRRWILEVDRMGWRVLPVYVGSQSPCVASSNKRHVPIKGNPWAQGAWEGRDAVRRAAALGMEKRSALYLDMEPYHYRSRANCAQRTLAFIRAWTHEVQGEGYLAGFYSSATTGVQHLEKARRSGVGDLPDAVWFARWRRPQQLNDAVLSRAAWAPHRRIHQYAGDVSESHGGVKMKIDRNRVDAPVAIISEPRDGYQAGGRNVPAKDRMSQRGEKMHGGKPKMHGGMPKAYDGKSFDKKAYDDGATDRAENFDQNSTAAERWARRDLAVAGSF